MLSAAPSSSLGHLPHSGQASLTVYGPTLPPDLKYGLFAFSQATEPAAQKCGAHYRLQLCGELLIGLRPCLHHNQVFNSQLLESSLHMLRAAIVAMTYTTASLSNLRTPFNAALLSQMTSLHRPTAVLLAYHKTSRSRAPIRASYLAVVLHCLANPRVNH